MACIACKKCERECPHDAIHVVDMLAVVDYEKCTGCGTCVEVCPQKCIDFYGHRPGVDAVAADGRGPDTPEVASVSEGA
jgi:Fe-S-cluster-containing hydrogenase component 2